MYRKALEQRAVSVARSKPAFNKRKMNNKLSWSPGTTRVQTIQTSRRSLRRTSIAHGNGGARRRQSGQNFVECQLSYNLHGTASVRYISHNAFDLWLLVSYHNKSAFQHPLTSRAALFVHHRISPQRKFYRSGEAVKHHFTSMH
jgi:hypothetical protein